MSRIVNVSKNIDDNEEISLRPKSLKDYIGQAEIKKNLQIYICAAKQRGEVLDHVLLYGPPGLGKTTLANVIANEMGARLITIAGPSLEKTGDLISLLTTLEPGDILFIDEIHRIPRIVEEVLYSAMEDYKISVPIQKEVGTSFMNLDIAPFTLIGATTRAGDLTAPLRARFGITEKLKFYNLEDISKIVTRTAKVMNTSIEEKAILMLAKRCRGTPRIANRLFRRIRDFSDYRKHESISARDAIDGLKSLKIDCLGLDEIDVKYLDTLQNRFRGGPVGLENIASTIGEETTNLEDIYEPYLLQIGLINRTNRGRVITPKGVAHLKKYHQIKEENSLI